MSTSWVDRNNLNSFDRSLVRENAKKVFDVKKIAEQYLNLHNN